MEKKEMEFMVMSVVAFNLILVIVSTILTQNMRIFSEARAMTAPMFAITLIPAFYMDLGTSFQIETIAGEGMRQWWLYAVSWYPAYILGILFAGMIRSSGVHLTLPDRLAHHGQLAEFLSSVVSYLYLMPLGSIFSIGLIMSGLTGYVVEVWVCMLFAGVILSWFTAEYGWSGYSITGIVYFVVMAIGVGFTSVTLIQTAGGWGAIESSLPLSYFYPSFTDIGGFLSLFTDWSTVIWFLAGFAFIVDPMVWQRFSLTDTDKSARNGMIFAFLFFIVFDITTVGSAFAMASIGGEWYVDTALEFLPGMVSGFMISGVLLASIAGNSAYLHAAGTIFSQNIAKSLGLLDWNSSTGDEESLKWYKRGVYILGMMGTVVIIGLNFMMPDDPITMAWLVQSAYPWVLIIPLYIGGVLFREIPSEAVEYGLLLGLIVTSLGIVGGFVFPNYEGVLALGITVETAVGTPLLDASRVLGFFSTLIGFVAGFAKNKLS